MAGMGHPVIRARTGGPFRKRMAGRMDSVEKRSEALGANRADRMSVSSSSIGRAMSDEVAQAKQV